MEEFRQIFNAHMELQDSMDALAMASALAKEKPSALLCYERDYRQCHRAIVAQKINVIYQLLIEHIGVVHGEDRKQNGGREKTPELARAPI